MFHEALAKKDMNENIYIVKLKKLKEFLKMYFLEQ